MLNSISSKLTLLLLVVFIFFGYIFSDINLFLFILAGASILNLILSKYLILDKQDVFLFLFILVCTFSISYSSRATTSIFYVYGLWSIFVINLCVRRNTYYKNIAIRMFYIFSGIHLLFTTIYLFIPQFVLDISQIILNTDSYNTILYIYSRGAVAGIAEQTGTNAIYISVFICIVFSKLISENKNIRYLFFLVIGMLGLLLTEKRGLLLANLITILFIYLGKFFSRRQSKSSLFLLLLSSVLIILLIPILGSYLYEVSLTRGSDITSGRLFLWNQSLNYFWENPIVGIGINTINSLLGTGTHNIYIQLLAEVGVLGFIPYVLFISYNFIGTLKKHRDFSTFYTTLSLYFQLVFLIYSLTGNPIYDFRFFLIYIFMVSFTYRTKSSNEYLTDRTLALEG